MALQAGELVAEIRRRRMKVTPQRQLLCSLIEVADDHPTVESIYHRAIKQMPTISLKTVYTTVTDLADLGLIKLSTIGSSSLRVDPNPAPHAHLVCKGCGRVVDQPLDPATEAIPRRAERIGFAVEEQELIFRGRCAACRQREDERSGDA